MLQQIRNKMVQVLIQVSEMDAEIISLKNCTGTGNWFPFMKDFCGFTVGSELSQGSRSFITGPPGWKICCAIPLDREHCIDVRQFIFFLSELELVPFDKHPMTTFSGALNIDSPSIDNSVLVVPSPTRIEIEIKRNIQPIVCLHHFAESHLCNFTDEVITGDLIEGSGLGIMAAEFNFLLVRRTTPCKRNAPSQLILCKSDVFYIQHSFTALHLVMSR